MDRQIAEGQIREIEETLFLGYREDAYMLLKEYAGIEAKPYIAWDFYDESGNYVGNSQDYSIRDLILEACVHIVKEAGDESQN